MLSFLIHTIFLSLSILLTYLWTQNPSLSAYNLQLTALLIIFYFLSRFISKNKSKVYQLQSTIILTAITLLLIFSTGGLKSPLFFLLDFLLFALALFFEPWQAGTTALILISVFLFGNYQDLNTQDILSLLSLLLITPLAILFGKKFLQTQAEAGKIKILEKNLAQEETSTLIWLSTKAKPTLATIIDSTSLIISSHNLPFSLQEKLKTAHQDLLALHQSANDLEKEIDQETD